MTQPPYRPIGSMLAPCLCHSSSRESSGFIGNISCSNNNRVLCSACVARALRDVHDRRQQALEEWKAAREECSKTLLYNEESSGPAHLSELQEESRVLRERVDQLRLHCADVAVQVCAARVENDRRQQELLDRSSIDLPRQRLQRIEEALCQESSGAMVLAIQQAQKQVRALRFQWALAAFKIHRLDVEVHYADRSKVQSGRLKHARGIGKIGGLPLPHAGPELFGVLPQDELQSALRLVASLTSLVSRCLGILLPHPILLKPDNPVEEDIADNVDGISSVPTLSNTATSSFASLAERATRSAFASSSGGSSHRDLRETVTKLSVPPSMDPERVRQRLLHSRSAILAEDQNKGSSVYSLSSRVINEDEFAIALQLLQNDVVALCIRAGVPVGHLWPAEAFLLNLYALCDFCKSQVKALALSTVNA